MSDRIALAGQRMRRLFGAKDQDATSLRTRVGWLQRALPLGIVVVVAGVYAPSLLDGVPVPVQMTVTAAFQLVDR